MQRRLELLEREHAIELERGRIAKDIHDDLGSSLTRIMMLGERVQEDSASGADIVGHVRKIVDSARSTVQSMDEIVWAIDPENDTLDGMAGYLSQYANQFFDATAIRCRIEMPTALPALLVPAELRHDFFLVFKEALSNVLKHSQASEARIQFAAREHEVTVIIEDNGRGFVPAATPLPGRNGLQNMRNRITALKGNMDLSTTPGSGTKLTFTLSMPSRRESFA
jgi:signal transduction histidine kinase